MMFEVVPGKVRNLAELMPSKSAGNDGDERPGALAAGFHFFIFKLGHQLTLGLSINVELVLSRGWYSTRAITDMLMPN